MHLTSQSHLKKDCLFKGSPTKFFKMKENHNLNQVLQQLEMSTDYLRQVENQIIGSFLMSIGIPHHIIERAFEKNFSVNVFMPEELVTGMPFDTRASFPSRLNIFGEHRFDESMLVEIRSIGKDSILDIQNYEISLQELRLVKNIDRIYRFEGDGLDDIPAHIPDAPLAMSMALIGAVKEERETFIKEQLTNDITKPQNNEVIKFLWGILDDIDSTGDIAKFDDKFYRKRVERLQKKRWETGITSNGYELDLSNMKIPN